MEGQAGRGLQLQQRPDHADSSPQSYRPGRTRGNCHPQRRPALYPQRIRARPGRTLTVDQARRLLDTAAGYRFEAAVILALTYGLRRGEVLGLHWSALDWKAGTLGVTHSVRRIKDRDTSSGRQTRLVIGELKTPKSRRTLALTPEMVAMFRQHRVCQAEAQMAAGQRWQDHGLIFSSETGTPMDPENFSRSFSRLCQRSGLGHWHPHELRHSGASLMLAQGTPLHVIGSQGRRCRDAVRFPRPPFNPYVRFSRIRLTDGLLDMVTLPLGIGWCP